MTAKLAKLVAWTGWTKEDWTAFLYILTPMNLMSKTGWTKEQWIDKVTDVVTVFVLVTFVYASWFLLAQLGLIL